MKTRFLQEAMANRWKSQTANSNTTRGPNYCDDALASGSGRAGPCAYDCVALQQAYLPQTTHTVKCFVYDASTGGWPQNLLKRIQVRQDTDVYVAPVAGVPHESVNFTVGSSTGKSCTDVLVRVNTTTHGHQAQWTVSNRDNTSDAVKFVSPSATGIFERTMCLHGRNWTIENSQTSGWQGTVGVVGWLPFRNTIVIPDVSDNICGIRSPKNLGGDLLHQRVRVYMYLTPLNLRRMRAGSFKERSGSMIYQSSLTRGFRVVIHLEDLKLASLFDALGSIVNLPR